MKVIVFGATGTVGRQNLLQAGHTVTAFARTPEKLGLANSTLKLITGDALNAQNVDDAVRGHDAVVVTLGPGCPVKA